MQEVNMTFAMQSPIWQYGRVDKVKNEHGYTLSYWHKSDESRTVSAWLYETPHTKQLIKLSNNPLMPVLMLFYNAQSPIDDLMRGITYLSKMCITTQYHLQITDREPVGRLSLTNVDGKAVTLNVGNCRHWRLLTINGVDVEPKAYRIDDDRFQGELLRALRVISGWR